MYDFPTIENCEEIKFNCKKFDMSNPEDVSEYCSIMTEVSTGKKTIKIADKVKISDKVTAMFFIYLEWVTFKLKPDNIFEGN